MQFVVGINMNMHQIHKKTMTDKAFSILLYGLKHFISLNIISVSKDSTLTKNDSV